MAQAVTRSARSYPTGRGRAGARPPASFQWTHPPGQSEERRSAAMTIENSADLVLFSAVLVVPVGVALPAHADLGARDIDDRPDGVRHFALGTARIEVHGSSNRQQLFEEASAQFLQRLANMGIDGQFIDESDSYVRLLISLTAVEGQAGILIKPEMMDDWRPFRPFVAIDA
jgi:hypothetical protein